ncbi:alpha/beta fold hydrolase [Zavarzinia sp. CC-PAN008]|uniref:alpha/beta fold hydrolase n=1 Tax=Zavarzinia sp. CC-PAN008 TaxID=3243332 RepID=UPI003F74973B
MNAATDLETSSSRFVTVDGIRIHYNEVGEGTPLVLIHGSGPGASGWANFSRNMGPLSKSYRAICVDLPGFGKSDMKPAGVPIPGWWAEKMGQFLDALGIEKAHFIGNSLGGVISLKLALTRPEKVGRMVLMGTGGSLPLFTPWPTEGIKAILGYYEGTGPSIDRLRAFAQQFVYDPSQLTDELLEKRLKASLDPRIVANPPMRFTPGMVLEEVWRDAGLARLPHETLMIWGREDRVLPLDSAFVLLKQIPRARLLVMPQCGHWAQWEHADEFNATVTGFFG